MGKAVDNFVGILLTKSLFLLKTKNYLNYL